MNIGYDYDKRLISDIAKNCGSQAVKSTTDYLHALRWRAKDKFFFFTIDGVCFCGGTFCKKHFRLAELAVKESEHKKGYGSIALKILLNACKANNIHKITAKTSINETAIDFYIKKGFQIVDIKGEEYEIEKVF